MGAPELTLIKDFYSDIIRTLFFKQNLIIIYVFFSTEIEINLLEFNKEKFYCLI